MPYIGNQPAQIGAYAVESFNGGGSSFTLSKSATTETVLLFIDGVRQTPTDAYSVSGTTLTTTAATPSGTNNVTVQFLGDVVDFGEPSDNSVTSGKIVDGTIVNADINASAAIALSKLASDPSNASNLTSGTVPTARLASGTADSTTFLRGDQTWASAGGTNTPVFEATMSANMSAVGTNTWAKVVFDTEVFDSDSAYDPATNYRFTVPSGKNGKYFIYSTIYLDGSSSLARLMIAIYKNGSAYRASHHSFGNSYPADRFHLNIHSVLDLAVSDYVEIYFWANRADSGNIVAEHQTSDNTIKSPVFGGFKLL